MLKKINEELLSRYNETINSARSFLESNGNVVVDLLNLTKKEREEIKEKFKDIEGVSFNAFVFDFSDLGLIKGINEKRGKETGKVIPDFIYDKFIKDYEDPEDKDFDNIVNVDGLKSLKNTKKRKATIR